VKIAEVDENGVPTAWEAVEFPSGVGGGSEEWELVGEMVTEEEVASILLPITSGCYRRLCGFITVRGTNTNSKENPIVVCKNSVYQWGDSHLIARFEKGTKTASDSYSICIFSVELCDTHSFGFSSCKQTYGTGGAYDIIHSVYIPYNGDITMLNAGMTNKSQIDSIGFWSSGVFASNTVVRIWGVRA
jgi:hypothetical protein